MYLMYNNGIGKGFSRSNLFNMRKFYVEYPNVQTVSGHLTWSSICELLIIENKDKLIEEVQNLMNK